MIESLLWTTRSVSHKPLSLVCRRKSGVYSFCLIRSTRRQTWLQPWSFSHTQTSAALLLLTKRVSSNSHHYAHKHTHVRWSEGPTTGGASGQLTNPFVEFGSTRSPAIVTLFSLLLSSPSFESFHSNTFKVGHSPISLIQTKQTTHQFDLLCGSINRFIAYLFDQFRSGFNWFLLVLEKDFLISAISSFLVSFCK